MAPESKAVATQRSSSDTPYKLDPSQTLRAATALLKKIKADDTARKAKSAKQDLLADEDPDSADVSSSTPIWLTISTKKHIVDKKSLKPGKIPLPHPYLSASTPSLRICLITADPQRLYKDLVDHPSFPAALRERVARVLGLEKLKSKYKSFESRRQLYAEYDVFLADDRIITQLPASLGKIFYGGGAKRPIPVVLQGRKQDKDEEGNKRVPLAKGGKKAVRDAPDAGAVSREIERAVQSALVHLSPGTSTAIKVGVAEQDPARLVENVEAVVAKMTEKYITKGWRNVRGIHVKGPNTAALPIWLADELWVDDGDVLEEEPVKKVEDKKARKERSKRKRGALTEGAVAGDEDDAKSTAKRLKADAETQSDDKAVKAALKESLKKQKEQARLATVAVV